MNRCAVAVLAVLFPIAAFGDITGNLTISANSQVSMDTATTVSSGGDFLWDGTKLTPQGNAKALNATALAGISGASGYATLTQTLISSFASLGSSAVITPATGTIVGYVTNGGNFGKLLVTSTTGTSLAIQYTTYISTVPKITGVQNNYSYLTPGLPNYGIAPGTLFIIKGATLASATSVSALQDPSVGIPTLLNGASVSVTVGGVTTTPGIYYAIATQIAAVLPSNTPAGTGTVTVTYAGAASNAQSIVVVPTALGLDTYYGTGSGLGVATNATTGTLYSYTNSIPPGTTVVLWGSGLGSTGDSDTKNTSTPHAVSNPPTFYVGGVQVAPAYAGRSVYPGVDQINLTIPTNAPTGCGISVVAVSGSGSSAIVSNNITLPIGNGVCSDPLLGYNGNQLSGGSTQATNVNIGGVSIGQSTSPQGEMTFVSASFDNIVTPAGSSAPNSVVSLGSCFVSTPAGGGGPIPTITGLDAGTITVTGPAGSQPLTEVANPLTNAPTGAYSAQVANSFLPPTGGAFTFTGSGGKDVGSFTASLSFGNILTWTNMSSITTVSRATGQNITWSGGTPSSTVYVTGSSSANGASATFVCYAPVSAGQLTVPNYVLLALPAGPGSLGLANASTPGMFTASGLTSAGIANGSVGFAISPTYQ